MYYKCHKISWNRGGSYIDSPDYIKTNKQNKNTINENDNKCFQYAATFVLNHEKIGKHLERISKIALFTDKYSCGEINYPSEKNDWEKPVKSNLAITLNVLYAKKDKNISCLHLKTLLKAWKTSYSF